jgi:hypothetical protein
MGNFKNKLLSLLLFFAFSFVYSEIINLSYKTSVLYISIEISKGEQVLSVSRKIKHKIEEISTGPLAKHESIFLILNGKKLEDDEEFPLDYAIKQETNRDQSTKTDTLFFTIGTEISIRIEDSRFSFVIIAETNDTVSDIKRKLALANENPDNLVIYLNGIKLEDESYLPLQDIFANPKENQLMLKRKTRSGTKAHVTFSL